MTAIEKKTATLLFFLLPACLLFAQKTDKVFLRNGDVITGEIKSMSVGLLSFDMTGPGTISIKWEEVKGLKSDKWFEVSLRQGHVVVTRIDSVFFDRYHIGLNDIVGISQIKDKFLQRLSGDIGAGFNYTKSNDILQSNLNTSLTYRIPKVEFGLKFNSVITNSKADSSLTRKQDLTLTALRYFERHYFAIGQLGWQENTALGLANRFLVNLAGGKGLLVNNHNRLLAGIGFSFNEEQDVENASYKSNFDGLVEVQYQRFYYSSPKFSLTTSLLVYPGLSDWGRVRTEFDVKNNFEIVKDFSIGLTFYDNFDNRPPAGATAKNDLGITFSLQYSFGK